MRKLSIYAPASLVALIGVSLVTLSIVQTSKAVTPQNMANAPVITCLSQDGSTGSIHAKYVTAKPTWAAKESMLQAHPTATLVEMIDKNGAVTVYWVCLSRNGKPGILSIESPYAVISVHK